MRQDNEDSCNSRTMKTVVTVLCCMGQDNNDCCNSTMSNETGQADKTLDTFFLKNQQTQVISAKKK